MRLLATGTLTRCSNASAHVTTKAPNAARSMATRAAGHEGSQTPQPHKIKVVGCGSSGLDYLASAAAYPKPDQKLRVDALEVQGGGNCANALTAAARLGLSPTIITKVGDDGLGDGIISELAADGIDTGLILRAPGHPTPFTYVVVDRKGGTRTCFHNPGPSMAPEEMRQELIQQGLKGAALVYFDGRLTEAALLLARAARSAAVPVLVEAERVRPGLDDLLQEADYIVTSAQFPQEWSGEACLGDAILEVASRFPNARMIVTTRGTKGSVCLVNQDRSQGASAGTEHCLQTVIDDLCQQLEQSTHGSNGSSSCPACISSNGIEIQPARILSSQSGLKLAFTAAKNSQAAVAAASKAAVMAVAANQGADWADAYTTVQTLTSAKLPVNSCGWQVHVATSARLPPEAVADTTGAGDSFIGSVIYGIATGMTPGRLMALGAVVAACKCTALGGKAGAATAPADKQAAAVTYPICQVSLVGHINDA